MTADRREIALPDVRVSYLSWTGPDPAGPVVLLLHGAGVDSAELSWGQIGPGLAAAGYRVIAPDHPGFGHSPAAPWSMTQDRLVGYVGDFVDALALDRYAIGGLSLGGGMAIGHVLARPQRVERAMLLASYGLMPRLTDGPLSLPRQLATWLAVRSGLLESATRVLAGTGWTLDWSLAQIVRDPARRTPELTAAVRAATRSGRGMAEFAQWQRDQVRWNRQATDYTPALPGFARPALIIHGTGDTGVPWRRAVAAADLIPAATALILPGAGHWVQRDRPTEVLAAMTDFLAGS